MDVLRRLPKRSSPADTQPLTGTSDKTLASPMAPQSSMSRSHPSAAASSSTGSASGNWPSRCSTTSITWPQAATGTERAELRETSASSSSPPNASRSLATTGRPLRHRNLEPSDSRRSLQRRICRCSASRRVSRGLAAHGQSGPGPRGIHLARTESHDVDRTDNADRRRSTASPLQKAEHAEAPHARTTHCRPKPICLDTGASYRRDSAVSGAVRHRSGGWTARMVR